MTPAMQRFFLALAALAAGVALYAMGQNEPGMLLIGAAVGFLAPRKATPDAGPTTRPPGSMSGLLLVGLVAFAASCTPGKAYVAADQGIFDAISPEYLLYVAADDALDAGQKARRERTVAAWKVLLDKAAEGDQ